MFDRRRVEPLQLMLIFGVKINGKGLCWVCIKDDGWDQKLFM